MKQIKKAIFRFLFPESRGGFIISVIIFMIAKTIVSLTLDLLVHFDKNDAMTNGANLLSFQKSLGFNIELSVQNFATKENLIGFFNFYYIVPYYTMFFGMFIYFYSKNNIKALNILKNIGFVCLFANLIISKIIPLSPPRFLQIEGFTDTVQKSIYAVVFEFNRNLKIVGEYAAFPSNHVSAAILWVYILKITGARKSWIKFSYLNLVFIIISVVATGNHYIIDIIGGGLFFLMGKNLNRFLSKKMELEYSSL